jgi:hypothetical protein
MDRNLLNYYLIKICEQLTTEQIIHSRRYRDWKRYDRLKEIDKLKYRLEELQIYEDDIDPEYIPKSIKGN